MFAINTTNSKEHALTGRIKCLFTNNFVWHTFCCNFINKLSKIYLQMSAKKEAEEIKYPCFIIDKPEGKDLFEGQSQNRIADNISQFLTENDKNKRKVIGIEGEWGSGKSNVIEILKNKLEKDYYFFIFDAWGHQEDLTRRSILEGLLSKLINEDVLKGDKKEWDKKLKALLARKVETESKNIPKLSGAVVLAILGIILMPITRILADKFLKTYIYPTSNYDISNSIIALGILIASFIPLITWIIYFLCKAERGKKVDVLSELFYIYRGKEIVNTSEVTISEKEPTVLQFTQFLTNLENNAGKSLIIVFDNMDRLPSAKVKEVWSSIHTFFASDDNDIKTWAIVPFDNEHICNIFIEDTPNNNGTKDRHRTDSYIHKTFSIVFHVSPPVLSDWKIFFFTKFEKAFGYQPPPGELIETIFDYHNIDNQKIKPREIICFINDLVALKKLWKEEIPFRYIALFALKRDEIMKDPFNLIPSNEYLRSLYPIFGPDENLETNISALTFNVPLDKADEILLKRTIENVLKGQGDFSVVGTKKSFFKIFDSAFYNSAPDIIHTISSLDKLFNELPDKSEINTYWEKLSNDVLKIREFELKYVNTIKTLVQRVSSTTTKERLLRFLFANSIAPDPKGEKPYTGAKYYDLIIDISTLMKDAWQGKVIEEILPENNVGASEYFEFLKVCPTDYAKYKVLCDAQIINDFLIALYNTNEIQNYSEQIKTIKNDTDLSGFKKHINEMLSILDTLDDCIDKIKSIYSLGRILSGDDGKLAFTIPGRVASKILDDYAGNDNDMDLLLSGISEYIINPETELTLGATCKEMLNNPDLEDDLIECYKYYFDYIELIKYHLQFPSSLTKTAIVKLTIDVNNLRGKDVAFLISKYNEIKKGIFDNKIDMLNTFIQKVNGFYYGESIQFVSQDNGALIESIIRDNSKLENKLMDDIIFQANKYIKEITSEQWMEDLEIDVDNYSDNVDLFKALVDENKYTGYKIPEALENAYADIIVKIARKEYGVPVSIYFWNLLIEMSSREHTIAFKDIRDELLYNVAEHSSITIEELTFFERGLFQFGALDANKDTASEVLRRILIPLASNDEKYIKVLKRNDNNIKNIIDKADDDSVVEFKNKLEEKCPEIFKDISFKITTDALLVRYNKIHPQKEEERDKA